VHHYERSRPSRKAAGAINPDGAKTLNEYKAFDIRFNKRDRTHTELLERGDRKRDDDGAEVGRRATGADQGSEESRQTISGPIRSNSPVFNEIARHLPP
jgi:hypothetical protein